MTEVIVSLLCTVQAIPLMVLRYEPFRGKVTKLQKRLIFWGSAAALLANFILYMHVERLGLESVRFYKLDMLVMCIATALMNLAIVRRYIREQVFVFGLSSLFYVLALSFGAFIMSRIGYETINEGLIIQNTAALVISLAGFYAFRKIMVDTVTPFLDIEAGDYWKTMWLLPGIIMLATVFSVRTDSYITTFLELGSRLCIGLVTVLLCRSTASEYRRFMEREELLTRIGQQKEHYEALAEKVRAERRDRHDFKHQIAALQRLIREGKLEEVAQYCRDAQQNLEEMAEVPQTGNAAADSILYHYAALARKDAITFSLQGIIGHVPVSDSDLICLLGNALDNAYEACQHVPSGEKKYIETVILRRGDTLMITVDNSFDGHLEREGDAVLSRKRGDTEEGIGIRSMQEIVRRYDGLCQFTSEGDRFEASFMLSIGRQAS